MRSRVSPASPWRDSDVTTVAITLLLGLIAIITAWFVAHQTISLTLQMMWLNVAVAGFAVSAISLGLWLMRGRRAIGERRVSLVSFEPAVPETAALRPPAAVARSATTAPNALVRIPGTHYVHDPSCPLVAGKDVEQASAGTGEPCGVCAS